jgi:hypothetical protein
VGEDDPGALKELATMIMLAAAGGCAGAGRRAEMGMAGAVVWVAVAGVAVVVWMAVAGTRRDAGRRSDAARKVAMLSMLGWSNACSIHAGADS